MRSVLTRTARLHCRLQVYVRWHWACKKDKGKKQIKGSKMHRHWATCALLQFYWRIHGLLSFQSAFSGYRWATARPSMKGNTLHAWVLASLTPSTRLPPSTYTARSGGLLHPLRRDPRYGVAAARPPRLHGGIHAAAWWYPSGDVAMDGDRGPVGAWSLWLMKLSV